MTMPAPERLRSMPVKAVEGCPHNQCSFCGFYKSHDPKRPFVQKFGVRPLFEVRQDLRDNLSFYGSSMFNAKSGKVDRVFIGDGDTLAMSVPHFLKLLKILHDELPDLTHVAAYARVRSILAKRHALESLRAAGLTDLYVGFETGLDAVLRAVRKGVTVAENIVAGRMAVGAGISLHAMIISGLGGTAKSTEHAIATADMLNHLAPETVVISRLMPMSIEEGRELDRPEGVHWIDEEMIFANRLSVGNRFLIVDYNCCGEHFETNSKKGLLAELARTRELVANGTHPSNVYYVGGG